MTPTEAYLKATAEYGASTNPNRRLVYVAQLYGLGLMDRSDLEAELSWDASKPPRPVGPRGL